MRTLVLALTVTLLTPWTVTACADLAASQQDGRFQVAGEHFRLVVDAAKGGQLVGLEQFDGSAWNPVIDGPMQSFPAICLQSAGREYLLANAPSAGFQQVEVTPQRVRFQTTARPRAADGTAGPWSVSLGYEIYAEGAVFVDLECVADAPVAELDRASVSFTVSPRALGAAKYRQEIFRGKTSAMPSARVALGVNPSRSFTNEIQILVEDNHPMAGKTAFDAQKGRFTWFLADGTGSSPAPKRYTNRLALALGAAATGKPRSNLIGQRVYHWINFIDRTAKADWFPTNEQIDRMAAHGATMLVLHQDWMLQSGRNGLPHADYTVARHEPSLHRTIEHAHSRNMRVGLYRRGIERYSLDLPIVGKCLRRDWDGFYVDWHSPHAIAQHEHDHSAETALGDKHYSADGGYLPARDYFLFTKRLRAIVGAKGFLIGHQGFGNAGLLPNLAFDAYLPGESSSDHRMFSDLDDAVFRGMMAGGTCMPWPLDSPVFSSPEGIAKMAAWGFYPHVGLGLQRKADSTAFTLNPDDRVNQFALPYWRLLSKIDVEQASVFNLPSQNRVAATCSNPAFYCIVYKQPVGDDAQFLAIVANLGKQTADTTVSLMPDVLGMKGAYRVERIVADTDTATVEGTTTEKLPTSRLPAWGIEGFRLRKQP